MFAYMDASTLRNKTQQLVNLVATVPNTNGSNPLLPTSRIANGEFAYRDQFPHHALIIIDNYGTCGGSLIDVSYILTTTYCTLQGSTFYVALGLTDMDTADSDVVTLISRTAIIHESYNSVDFSNNIAIIKLHDSVTLNFFVRLVSLPSFSDSDNTFEGQDVQVSGWGETSSSSILGLTYLSLSAPPPDDTSPGGKLLRYINTHVMSNLECAKVYPGSYIQPSVLCTDGTGHKGIHHGDSGSPLVINNDGGYVQIGIASFHSENGCSVSSPSAYTRVTSHLAWISDNTNMYIMP
uniref:Peptidase S1 domain-containing protein n=1 Tax=Timema genevievae TaxID=629358 RepID=A0A7R9JYQ5_TIMGE|nr:unnamed protein product [Timema genevievae]